MVGFLDIYKCPFYRNSKYFSKPVFPKTDCEHNAAKPEFRPQNTTACFSGVLVENLLLGFLDMMTEKLLKLLLETPPRIQPKYDVRIYHRVNTI